MVFRKLPGVSASGMGLRLSQKFVFLLFLSALVTLCFGALFFLPDSVRLKRIFLSKTETQPVTVGSGSENDVREHFKKPKEQDHPRGMTSAKGETSTRLKSLRRKPPLPPQATEERLSGGRAQEDLTLSRSRTESASEKAPAADRGSVSDTFSYARFQRCLLKPPLGRDHGKPSDPRTDERREKVKEVRMDMTGAPRWWWGGAETVEEFDTSCAVASTLICNKNMGQRLGKRRETRENAKLGSVFEINKGPMRPVVH